MEWHVFLIASIAAIATTPLAFFLPLCPCCESGCEVADGKSRTDPANEGTWVPSGTWRGVGGVTWTFTANPGDDSGETWFFFGSASTSKVGGGATLAEQQDWGNICNWYSNKTTSPSTLTGLSGSFDKRATRLPPADAVVHVYTNVSTVTSGPQTVQYAYFWSLSDFISGSEITSTAAAHDSVGGAVFNGGTDNSGTVNGGATFNSTSNNFGIVNGGGTFNDDSNNDDDGTVNGGATFNDAADNFGTVNDGATFNNNSRNFNPGTVNDGATFNDDSINRGTVNDGATFNDDSGNFIATVNGGATFNDTSSNAAIVNDGATFNNNSRNFNPFVAAAATVNGGATFNDTSDNSGTVNGGATFNNTSKNLSSGTVNDGATFNDAACSDRTTGNFFSVPCDRKFVAHPTDLPTCNGTAPDGCANSADTCGCG
jgi:hypothetical protein